LWVTFCGFGDLLLLHFVGELARDDRLDSGGRDFLANSFSSSQPSKLDPRCGFFLAMISSPSTLPRQRQIFGGSLPPLLDDGVQRDQRVVMEAKEQARLALARQR
jgi:hypothetical protein